MKYKEIRQFFKEVKTYYFESLKNNKLISTLNRTPQKLKDKMNSFINEYPEFQKSTYLIKSICFNKFPKKCLQCKKRLTYSNSINNHYHFCSKKCGSESNIVKQRRQNTFLKTFGTLSPLGNKEIQEKIKQANLQKYGVEYVFQSTNFKEKSKQTCLKKYGVEYTGQVTEFKEKAKQTCLEKYGIIAPILNIAIKEKIQQTNLDRYGSISPFGNKEIQEKAKQTCLEKYGVENPMKNLKIKEQVKQTCLQKYGVENVLQISEIKEKVKQTCLKKYGVENPMEKLEIKEQVKQTCLKKYGVENPILNIAIKEKIQQTNLDRYGSISPFGNKEIQEKSKQTCLQKYNTQIPSKSLEIKNKIMLKQQQKSYDNLIEKCKKIGYQLLTNKKDYSNIYQIYEWKHLKCGTIFTDKMHQIANDFNVGIYIPCCPTCYKNIKNTISYKEKEIVNYLKDIYKGEIIENNRELIKPLELDIVIPDKKFAIEFNR